LEAILGDGAELYAVIRERDVCLLHLGRAAIAAGRVEIHRRSGVAGTRIDCQEMLKMLKEVA
jgi:hypothetical protein